MSIHPEQGNSLNYENLLGQLEWSKLHPDIKQRFSCNNASAVTYQGVMSQVSASFSGKLLAQCCRIIGNPLALHTGKNIPIKVNVYPNQKLNGMTWDRFYQFKHQPVNRVKSTKCIRAAEGLVEMVGFGFGMKLEVSQEKGAIVFKSSQFFWQLGKLKLAIPDWLSPGETIVSQKALDNGRFEFKLQVTHLWLGQIFSQVGEFTQVL